MSDSTPDLSYTLHSADFKAAEGEEEFSNEAQNAAVFSRSEHLKSLGLNLNIEDLKLESDQIDASWNLERVSDDDKGDHITAMKNGSNIDGKVDSESWEQLEMEFMDELKVSEGKASNSSTEDLKEIEQSRQDLLIEMITHFHQPQDSEHNKINVMQRSPNPPFKVQVSPTKQRRQLLSLNTLEAIKESDLDRTLDNADNLESSHSQEDSDLFSESDLSSPFSPYRKRAWGMKSNTDDSSNREAGLMEQLHQLSLTQSSGHSGIGDVKTSPEPTPPKTTFVRPQASTHDRSTTFIDLRSSSENNTRGALNSTNSRLDSDSDEDESCSWEKERRMIKRQSQLHPSSTSLSKSSTHNLCWAHKVTTINTTPTITYSVSTSAYTTSASTSVSTSASATSASTSVSTSASTSSSTCDSTSASTSDSTFGSMSGSTSAVSIPAQRSTCASSTLVDVPSDTSMTGFPSPTAHHQSQSTSTSQYKNASDGSMAGAPRKRNPNSSSFSDGDIPSSEYVSPSSEDQLLTSTMSEENPGMEVDSFKSKKSKKKGRKSKKSQKKNKSDASTPSSTKSSSSKRRAHVLQRIRRDSLNTSSDEEHSLSSNSESSLTVGISAPAEDVECFTKDKVDTSLCEDEIKQNVKHRIFSKKPPAYFETPGTDPIFHEDVSFSSHLVDNILPSTKPAGLLVMSLLGNGLVTLPTSWINKLSPDTVIELHSFILTWLVVQAAEDCSTSVIDGAVDHDDDKQKTNVLFAGFPFSIAGLQQTLLDNNPVILVAIKERISKGTDSCMDTNLFSKATERFLLDFTLGRVLQHFDSVTSVSSLPKFILEEPLNSFFTFLDDTSPLSTPISFYWYSCYHASCLPSAESLASHNMPITTMCTLSHTSFVNAALDLSLFQTILSNGLGIVGMGTAYGNEDNSLSSLSSSSDKAAKSSMMLSLAIRGPNAIFHWMDLVGPHDAALAQVTDPSSLTAKFGSNHMDTLRTPFRSVAALAKWFGGRACLKTGSVFGMSDPHTKSERRKRQRVRFSETQSESEDSLSSVLTDQTMFLPPLVSNRPRLIVPAYSKSLLVVSPAIPPSCYGTIFSACNKMGFDIFGAKRVRLNAKRAAVLDIPGEFLSQFTPSSVPPSPNLLLDPASHPLSCDVATQLSLPPLPSAIIIVGRESSDLHTTALQHLVVTDLKSVLDKNPHIQIDSNCLNSPRSLMHASAHEEVMLKAFGSFTVPVSQNMSLMESVDENSDEFQEELCFLAVVGRMSLPLCADLFNRIFHITAQVDPDPMQKQRQHVAHISQPISTWNIHKDHCTEYPELVGMKIIPQLSRFHSKKLCPLSPNDLQYSQGIQLLTDKPATLAVFRGVHCQRVVHAHVKSLQAHSRVLSLEQKLQYIVSQSFAEGINLSCLFFSGKDLFADPKNWRMAPYLPPAWIHESDILQSFLTRCENLFSVVQLPFSQMKLALKVLDKLSRSRFQFVGISPVRLSTGDRHSDEHGLYEAGVAVCVERKNAVWAAEHVILPFAQDRQRADTLRWSKNFNSSILDVKSCFPGGVWMSESNPIINEYKIPRLSQDSFSNVLLPEECQQSSISSPLNERTAILLPPSLLTRSAESTQSAMGFVRVLEVLHQAQFVVFGMKMVLLSNGSAQELKFMLPLNKKLEELTCGPCLAVVLERDNAASCFQVIVKSVLQMNYNQVDYLYEVFSAVIAPKNAKEAGKLLSLLQCCH